LQNGHIEIVKHLVEHGADVNISTDKKVTLLHIASEKGHTEIVKHLVEHGVDVNICRDENVTPLYRAS
jgi:ankyrin repeat protein